jgi:voltage-gated sodium channel
MSFFTLFQVMTLEAWAGGVARPIMEVYPYAWIFFILFILTATFTVLNLFVAVIVNSLNTLHNEEESDKGNDMQTMRHELDLMRRDVKELREHLLKDRDRHV